jgi:hypothetical protein
MLNNNTLFGRFENQGFIKTTTRPELDAAQKVQLNRKGNELFNKGDIAGAERIFITTGYSDGLIRLGDWYLAQGKSLEALKMYWLAPDKKKAEPLIEKLAALIQKLIEDEEK